MERSSSSDGIVEAAGEDAAGADTIDDAPLSPGMDDLAALLAGEAGGSAAESTPSVSRGAAPAWNSKVCTTNRYLRDLGCLESPSELHGRLRLTQTTGVHNFCVDAQSAALTNRFLLDRWNRDDYGFLKVGLATFAGYGDYQKVEVEWDKDIAPAVQESFSTRVPPTCIHHVIENTPGLEQVTRRVCRQLQLDYPADLEFLKMMHFLVQADAHVWPRSLDPPVRASCGRTTQLQCVQSQVKHA